MTFLGHIYRADGIENLILTGRIPGSRRQGRQRLGIMDNLCAWTGRGKIDLLRAMRDRREWRAIVAEDTGHVFNS